VTQYLLIAANFAAISLLIFGIYFPRHRHRDMVVAYVGINAGVVAISAVLSAVDASVGLGIGLFGVLSIIRLRSSELDQREVAYYFASLALGLLGGTLVDSWKLTAVLMATLLFVMWFIDHPRLLGMYRVQVMTIDRAFIDERQLKAHLSQLLGGEVRQVAIRRVDMVNDTTNVEVRYELRKALAVEGVDGLTTVRTARAAW
jgi:hypothetical protein